MRPSAHTKRKIDTEIIELDNAHVVDEIRQLQEDPDTDYGYEKTSDYLKIQGFLINSKKVYRLMKEAQLLKERHPKQAKSFVKYRKVFPTQPFEVLEMDIKFVWIEEYKRHAYVLSVIDTFTRVILHGYVAYSIKKEDVKKVWGHIIVHHLQPNDCLKKQVHIELRNDNDSRFSAKEIQAFFEENHLNQVFTHPYTPQENGHIESFHAILSKKLKQYKFWSIDQLNQVIILFYDKYNNQRLHSSICNLPPNIFLECWNKNLITQTRDEKKRTIKFKLNINHNQLLDNTSLQFDSSQEGVIPPVLADEQRLNNNEEMTSAGAFQQTLA